MGADVFPHPGVPCRIPDASEQAANAALLIAAPHLLEVVRAVAMYFGDSKGRMGSPLGEAAKAALAKAGVSAIAAITRTPPACHPHQANTKRQP